MAVHDHKVGAGIRYRIWPNDLPEPKVWGDSGSLGPGA